MQRHTLEQPVVRGMAAALAILTIIVGLLYTTKQSALAAQQGAAHAYAVIGALEQTLPNLRGRVQPTRILISRRPTLSDTARHGIGV